MSENKSLEDTLDWFNNRISSSVSKYRHTAIKQVRTILDRVEELKTAAHRFDYSDLKDPDVYQNYATTIYNKTLEMFEDLESPENVTYNILDALNRDFKNRINTYTNLLAKYLSWLKRDRSYKNNVKNLDRALTRVKEDVYAFENKTLVSYSEIVKYEKVADDIEALIDFVERKKEIVTEINSHVDDITNITKIVDKKQKELDELKNHPGYLQLEKNKKELDHIEILISNKISEIKKLSSKVLKAAESKKVELDDYDKDIMKSLIKDPLTTLVKEGEGYRGIKATLRILKEVSASPAVQMKKEKLKRAYENIEEILNDGLAESQQKAKFLISQSEAINRKFSDLKMNVRIKKLNEEINNYTIDRQRITLSLEREKEDIEEKVTDLVKSVEKRIEEYIEKTVKLVLE
ncbi:MAG: hypothetical protein KAS47_01480 [Candidatus Heimdallarchaeota archaeon]|nr:hypothetical protein [Candidatus Heimdallarchaeota archaeon]